MSQTKSRRLLGMPYDFRPPTWRRIKARMWCPGGPMWTPRVWGWGYTLNFAHKGSWVVVTALMLFAFGTV